MPEALNLQTLAADLKSAGSPWEMDPTTDMAQMTEVQRRIRLGFTPPPGEMSIEDAAKASEAAPTVTPEIIAAEAIGAPASFDLRDVGGRNYTTPVKNQRNCGSCVAFATVAVLETTARFDRKNPNLDLDLSEAHMFYCHAKEEGRNCSNGWWPDRAFNKAKEKGVTFEEHFPYTAGDQNCALTGGWRDALATPTGFRKLDTRAKMKDWISKHGSITGCFVVYQDFFSYRSGVYRHVSGGSAGGHCVEIIGYNDAQACWICKNSWGPNWGEGGYFRIGYGQCNIETWAGPYGVDAVNLRLWDKNTRVTALWSNNSDRNAYVHLTGVGWRQVARSTTTVQHTMLSQLVAAKAASRRVDALQVNNQIRQVYVL